MLVTGDAKYGSRRSEVDLAAMSKQEPTSVTSSAAKPSVIKESFNKKGQSIKAVRRRAYPIDAATCTASGVVDVDRKRREYPIDAATCAAPVVIDVDRRRNIPLTRLLVPHPLSLMRKKVWRASEGSHH